MYIKPHHTSGARLLMLQPVQPNALSDFLAGAHCWLVVSGTNRFNLSGLNSCSHNHIWDLPAGLKLLIQSWFKVFFKVEVREHTFKPSFRQQQIEDNITSLGKNVWRKAAQVIWMMDSLLGKHHTVW